MATNMKRFSLYLRTILLLICTFLHICEGYDCPYGQNCDLLPAPPGQTPACIKPGLTYCEYPENYPEKLIQQLLEAGQYDISTLLIDETQDEFKATKKSLPSLDCNAYSKDYNNINTRYRHDAGILWDKTPLQPPSPADPYQDYSSPSRSNYWQPDGYDYEEKALRNGFNNYFDSPSFYPNYKPNEWFRQQASRAGVTRYNPTEWWKYVSPSRSNVASGPKRRSRNAELVTAASKRTLTGAEALRMALGFASAEISAERPRRQAADTFSLCEVDINYVKPRAAMNIEGNYMFIVNTGNMTQDVRTETCKAAGSTCSGLCSISSGYTTKCEQKVLQKRLIAVKPEQPNIYNDIFWMPSCCQCTVIPASA